MPAAPRPDALALALALALASVGCASAGVTAQSQPGPAFHADARTLNAVPGDSIRNANGSPRLLSDSAYRRFLRDVAPKLREWSQDPRLAINPAFVAALVAKESAFDPQAVSPAGAYGVTQLTPRADTDLRTRAGTPTFAWMLPEIQSWPRDSLLRGGAGSAAAADEGRALAVMPPRLAAAKDYLFDPVLETRAAVFWLRMLEAIWTTDVWPGAYGALAREKLNGPAPAGTPLTEIQLLDLATVSYNQGVEYVRALLSQWGPAWTGHLDPEPADYLERVRSYTRLFQR